tara:strand:- start:37 stop:306 length:270 start_codon:yes stop_codon:yes gene_type:complete
MKKTKNTAPPILCVKDKIVILSIFFLFIETPILLIITVLYFNSVLFTILICSFLLLGFLVALISYKNEKEKQHKESNKSFYQLHFECND